MNRIRVGITAGEFIKWGGGIDFLSNIVMALALSDEVQLLGLVPYGGQDNFEAINSRSEYLVHSLKSNILGALDRVKSQLPDTSAAMSASLEQFALAADTAMPIAFYRPTMPGLLNMLRKKRVNVIMPVIGDLGRNFPIPWVGYIWDLQHIDHPEYFAPDENSRRDNLFLNMCKNAPSIMVNSRYVKAQVEHYYPESKGKVFVLSFLPVVRKEWLADNSGNILEKYKLPERYFLVSNQFWQHKDHMCAFQALNMLKNRNIHLVCTGKFEEPRNPEYIVRLKKYISDHHLEKRIHILGFISKNDQIALLKKSLAAIQPTLYEGGPGGGIAYNALALGKKIIISDIDINREIKNSRALFFKAGNVKSLSEKMLKVIDSQIENISSQDQIIKVSNKNLFYLHRDIMKGVELAGSNWRLQKSYKLKGGF